MGQTRGRRTALPPEPTMGAAEPGSGRAEPAQPPSKAFLSESEHCTALSTLLIIKEAIFSTL